MTEFGKNDLKNVILTHRSEFKYKKRSFDSWKTRSPKIVLRILFGFWLQDLVPFVYIWYKDKMGTTKNRQNSNLNFIIIIF